MANERPARYSVMLDAAEYECLNSDRESNNDLKQAAMIRAYQRGWRMLTDEQQHAALRGVSLPAANIPGEATGTIHNSCNAASRAALDLRETVDELLADGKLSRTDRTKIRRKSKALVDAACGVAVHANDPSPALAG